MRNPFGSESSAYHFLLLTVVAFGIVAVASAMGGPLGAAIAWAIVSAGAIAVYARGRERRRPEAVEHVGPPDERRIVVVAPLRASPLHRLANDVDPELEDAQLRARAAVKTLGAPHVRVTTAVGDDAVAAVGDALRTFGGDHIFVLPGDDALADELREHYAVPVSVVDE
jgi:hypothetical protein